MKVTFLSPTFIRNDKRGHFFEMLNGSHWENISYGKMRKGAVMGNHYHKKALVFFFVLSGLAKVNLLNVETKDKSTHMLSANEGILFEPNVTHAVIFQKASLFLMGKSKAYKKELPDTYSYIVE